MANTLKSWLPSACCSSPQLALVPLKWLQNTRDVFLNVYLMMPFLLQLKKTMFVFTSQSFNRLDIKAYRFNPERCHKEQRRLFKFVFNK